MTAQSTDKFRKYSDGSEYPNIARVASPRSTGGTTLACDDLSGWATDTGVDFITYQLDTAGDVVSGSQTTWRGVVSADSITNITRVKGAADSGNPVNDVVMMIPSSVRVDDLVDGILVSLDQDGTLKAGAVDNSDVLDDTVVTKSKIDFSTFNSNLADTEYAVPGLFFLGQQVYQKIITFGALPNATSKSVNHGITNLQYFTHMSGIAFTSGLTTISLPFVGDSTGSTNKASLVGNTASIVVTTESNRTAFATTYITLRYTKTA